MKPIRYIMVGGFLGAGKTTAILKLALKWQAAGLRVGLITNDQSVGLVDTALLASHNLPVEEITGGCFCCRFNSLTDAAAKLSTTDRPDLFLAEPVGSCTDLVATVSYPLRRMYGSQYSVAAYSVLVDPNRAERMLGIAGGNAFSAKVMYIYMKQLEEAEIIVVNKADLLDVHRLDRLLSALGEKFPKARTLTISAREGTNIDSWADLIASTDAGRANAMEVDYDLYADGEALLGWVNISAQISATDGFDGNALLLEIAAALHRRLQEGGIEIAHLKMTLNPTEGNDLAVVNLVRSDGTLEASHHLRDSLTHGELLLNLRAEADPDLLRVAAMECLMARCLSAGILITIDHEEAFRPDRPVPTHRLVEA